MMIDTEISGNQHKTIKQRNQKFKIIRQCLKICSNRFLCWDIKANWYLDMLSKKF